MRHLIIQNPRAGRNRRGRSSRDLESAFQARGMAYELHPSSGPGHASEIMTALGDDHSSVIVVGGDGTLHEVIQGMNLERHRLAVVPWGTGNDFAWDHGWTNRLDACLDRIQENEERHVDLGLYEATFPGGTRSGRFHNSIGLGFEASINAQSHRIQWIRGPLVYVLALLGSLHRYRTYHLRLRTPGADREIHISLMSIANGRRVGGCFLIAPEAKPDDGKLDVVHAEGMSLIRAMQLLPRIMAGSHLGTPRVHLDREASLRIDSDTGVPVYVDGEFLDHRVTALDIRVAAGALRTY